MGDLSRNFSPIGLSQDSTGEFCRSLFQVLLFSLLMSWILAITVTPLFGVMFLKTGAADSEADPYGGAVFRGYKAFLTFCLRHRWITVILLAALLVLSVRGFGLVKQSFFPASTRPQFMVHYWLPQGTHITKTEADLRIIEQHIMTMDGVTNVTSCAGGGPLRFLLTFSPEEANSAYALFLVDVDDYKKIDNLIPTVQEYIDDNFPNSQAFSRKFVLGPGEAQKIQVRFRGPNQDVLRNLARKARQIMVKDPDAVDIVDDWRQRVPLITPVVAETRARNAGITRSNIANALQVAYGGKQVGVYREGDKLLPIIARSPETERTNVDNLKDVHIWSPVAQKNIPLAQVVTEFETNSENSIIRRRDRLPTITVKCDPKVGEASPVFNKLRPKMETIDVSAGYTLEWGGEYEDSGDSQAALAAKIPSTFLMMILIVIFLFNSIKKPLVIFLTVPLAIIGVTAGLLLTNQPFGFMALLGILSLVGMLIKNAIVLVDEIGLQSEEGKDLFTAIVDSGISRMRPVSMAALTTVLGMIPLVADAFFVSMAVTIMFGLAFATVLTLICVPVLYAILFKAPSRPDSQS